MDDDKIERRMEFIVEQQAQFAAKIGQIEDNLARQGETVERLNAAVERQGENVERLSNTVERLTGAVELVVDTVGRLVDTVGRLARATAERFDDTDRKIAALVDSQIRTEETVRKLGENIDDLTAVVERHITEGHRGRTEGGS